MYFEYLPINSYNTIDTQKIFEDEIYSLLLNLFDLDKNNKIIFSDFEKLLFIKKEEFKINEFDLDDTDFNITNIKEFITS